MANLIKNKFHLSLELGKLKFQAKNNTVLFLGSSSKQTVLFNGYKLLRLLFFLRIALGKTTWNVVDVAVAIALIAITIYYRKTNNTK